MKWIPIIFGLMQFLFFAACAGLLIYLIMKRIEDRKKETFERREN